MRAVECRPGGLDPEQPTTRAGTDEPITSFGSDHEHVWASVSDTDGVEWTVKASTTAVRVGAIRGDFRADPHRNPPRTPRRMWPPSSTCPAQVPLGTPVRLFRAPALFAGNGKDGDSTQVQATSPAY